MEQRIKNPVLRRELLSLARIVMGLAVLASVMHQNARGQAAAEASATPSKPIEITLDEAIKRAEANEASYASAQAENKAASLDRWNAYATLLPSAVYHNQAVYTQPLQQKNQSGQTVIDNTTPRFIANNGVHEYVSQAVVNETIGLGRVADVRMANATAARAKAELEIARRGLVAAVSSLYFGAAAAANKLTIAERARKEAEEFLALTTKREEAREAAHADVVKAQLTDQQRVRELADARLEADKARLELGVLLFPDPRTEFTLATAGTTTPLATRDEVNTAASRNNPELKKALAELAVANGEVLSSRAAYLPDLSLNYAYGIDAAQFATYGPNQTRNLGYSASVTIDFPVWDWLSTERKIRQSEIRRQATKVALSTTQRRLIARLDEAYAEARSTFDQLESLDKSVSTAAESLRLTKLRYAEGESTVLEVVDAQTTFVSAENARENGRIRYEAARADLQNLTGTL
jgi:outer membrane protein TolC